MSQLNFKQIALGMMLAVVCMVVGASLTNSREAWGEVRGTPQPQAFQSGGQMSVPVLKEISSTLRQIDSRLARLETVAQKLATPTPRTAAVGTTK